MPDRPRPIKGQAFVHCRRSGHALRCPRCKEPAKPDLTAFLTLVTVFAVMTAVLGLRVSLRRVALGGIALGDAGDDGLHRRIRAHGNFVEYAPMMGLTVLAMALAGVAGWAVWAVTAAFVAARIVHAWAIGAAGRTVPLAGAMVVQHSTMVLAAGAILWALLG